MSENERGSKERDDQQGGKIRARGEGEEGQGEGRGGEMGKTKQVKDRKPKTEGKKGERSQQKEKQSEAR